MKATAENRLLCEALEDLETALETPVIPGELAAWVDNVRRQSGRATQLLGTQIENVHVAQCDEIAGEDNDLLRCADQLRTADQELLRDFASFDLVVFDLPEKALRAEPDEAKFTEVIQVLCARGLELVIRARTQEVAIATWLVEAFNRDLGEV